MGLCLKGCSLINNHCAIDLQKEIEVGALNYWGGLGVFGEGSSNFHMALGGGPFQKQNLYLSPALRNYNNNNNSLIDRNFHYVFK